ncbi:hypothetical protein Ancab_024405 [Ancistrocladus abbreviatus]
MATKPQPSLSLPLTTKVQLALLNLVTDSSVRSDGTVNRRLYNFIDRKAKPNAVPYKGVKTYDVTVVPSRDLWFRLFIPTQQTTNDVVSLPLIVFFHGGGFVLLNAASIPYNDFCRRLARQLNAVILSVNYRLAPEHKLPSQYDDGLDVLKFIDENRQSIEFWPKNADVRRCFIAGDSAGGNITHNLAVRACGTQFRELSIIGLIVMQPFFGGKERVGSEIRLEGAPIVSVSRTDRCWKAALPAGIDTDHGWVNVYGPNALDISCLDLPPILLFVGGFDPLRDRQLRYHEWLKESGKEVLLVDIPTACHCFFLFPELSEASILYKEAKDFTEKQCSKIQMEK